MPSALATAIANAEGYGIPGAIPTMANNPGDLKNGDIGNGVLGSGITVYGSSDDGWAALENQLGLIASGQSRYYTPNMTIAQVAQVWAGSSAWGNNVANYLGVSPATPFGSVYGGGSLGEVVTEASADLQSFLPTTPMGVAGWGVGIAVVLALLLD